MKDRYSIQFIAEGVHKKDFERLFEQHVEVLRFIPRKGPRPDHRRWLEALVVVVKGADKGRILFLRRCLLKPVRRNSVCRCSGLPFPHRLTSKGCKYADD